MADKIRMIHKDGRVKLHNKAYAKSEYAAKDGWSIQDPTLENDTPVAKEHLGWLLKGDEADMPKVNYPDITDGLSKATPGKAYYTNPYLPIVEETGTKEAIKNGLEKIDALIGKQKPEVTTENTSAIKEELKKRGRKAKTK